MIAFDPSTTFTAGLSPPESRHSVAHAVRGLGQEYMRRLLLLEASSIRHVIIVDSGLGVLVSL